MYTLIVLFLQKGKYQILVRTRWYLVQGMNPHCDKNHYDKGLDLIGNEKEDI